MEDALCEKHEKRRSSTGTSRGVPRHWGEMTGKRELNQSGADKYKHRMLYILVLSRQS